MPFDLDQAFGIHPLAVAVRAKRAEIIAGNLANADTPGYKARDLDFQSLLRQARNPADPTAVRTTHPQHQSPTQGVSDGAWPMGELLYRTPTQPSVDGNTVDGQVEKVQFAENAVQYQASLQFLNGRIRNLMLALRGD